MTQCLSFCQKEIYTIHVRIQVILPAERVDYFISWGKKTRNVRETSMYLHLHCTYVIRRCQQMPFLLGLNFNQLKLAPHATTQRQVLTSKTQIALRNRWANVG